MMLSTLTAHLLLLAGFLGAPAVDTHQSEIDLLERVKQASGLTLFGPDGQSLLKEIGATSHLMPSAERLVATDPISERDLLTSSRSLGIAIHARLCEMTRTLEVQKIPLTDRLAVIELLAQLRNSNSEQNGWINLAIYIAADRLITRIFAQAIHDVGERENDQVEAMVLRWMNINGTPNVLRQTVLAEQKYLGFSCDVDEWKDKDMGAIADLTRICWEKSGKDLFKEVDSYQIPIMVESVLWEQVKRPNIAVLVSSLNMMKMDASAVLVLWKERRLPPGDPDIKFDLIQYETEILERGKDDKEKTEERRRFIQTVHESLEQIGDVRHPVNVIQENAYVLMRLVYARMKRGERLRYIEMEPKIKLN